MKRRDFLRATGAAAVALIVSGPPAQGANDSQGAVKAVLNPDDGWAILSTNAQNDLIAQVHLAQGLSETTYAVTLWINGNLWSEVGSLTTNAEGNGNAHVVVPVSQYAQNSESSIEVQVILAAVE